MTRGVSQLLFNYLPHRTVDWEDGLAIVKLGGVRLSGVWEPERATVLLDEIGLYLDRWRGAGGAVDPQFPNPRHERERFAVGLPEAIDASVLDTAFLCQSCATLSFPPRRELGRAQVANTRITCPQCHQPTIRQFGQVFVHGCGELVPVAEWIPGVRSAVGGSLEPFQRPLRCPRCGTAGRLVMPARSERVRDMRIVCRSCDTTVVERFTARCHRCTRRIIQERRAAGHVGAPGQDDERSGDTVVARVAMRMSRYSANDTYYPQTISMLRLDRPTITSTDDPEQRELRRLLPIERRPDAQRSSGDTFAALADMLKRAEAAGDTAQQSRIMARIAALATAPTGSQAESTPDEDAPLPTAPDVTQIILESLAFRTTVSTRAAASVVQEGVGATALLGRSISDTQQQLGLRELLLVDDLPVITATFGYTRRSFQPTYEELSAHHLPTEIRVFPSLDRYAAQRLARPDLVGTVPILAREGEHEGIFLSLEPERVLRWLERNGVALASPDEAAPLTRILAVLEPIDRYYDRIWETRVRRLVFGLVHSLSHGAMRAASWFSGLERTSLSEYVFLPLLGTVIFDNSSTFRMGGLETLVRDQLGAFLDAIANDAVACLYDAECIDHRGACHGCIHSPEISCRVFNHGLSRAFLIGGHTPWLDIATDDSLIGYWQLDESQA